MCRGEKGDHKVFKKFCMHVKEILERQWSRKKLCDEVETLTDYTYLGDRVSADGGNTMLHFHTAILWE